MFNIGPLELMVVLLIALVVVGPKRLPEIGRTIGKALHELRKVQTEVRDTIRFDLDTDDDEPPTRAASWTPPDDEDEPPAGTPGDTMIRGENLEDEAPSDDGWTGDPDDEAPGDVAVVPAPEERALPEDDPAGPRPESPGGAE